MAESSSSSSFLAISTSDNNNIQPRLYDVFVSFRGEDVRKNFVSHLQAAFKRKGIATFFDEELKRGREISPALLKAIQQSPISIVVFSENYASSRWCLNELLKILECRNMVGQMIMPVFYHVDPSNVRKQTGSYAEAFTRHEKTLEHGKHVIQKWREALTEIADLSGFDSANWILESEMIDKITQEILTKLDCLTLNDVDHLVGIGGRVERIIKFCLFADGSKDDVRILGIWGMGGIGKTTVARTLFHEIKNKFDGYCFLENVRENSGKNGHGLPDLRKKLLSQVTLEEQVIPMDISCTFLKKRLCGKKVLIVLDDIDDMEQLENLAGGHNWFGVGSRIVITTRNRQLLTDADGVYNYAREQLSNKEALHLFSHHAFKTRHPPKVYLEFSRKAINYACGNPLALKLLGSYLRKKDEKTWESAFARLERFSDNKIVKRVLELSFEGLDSNQKNILLDVACFLKGYDVEFATSVWDVCGFYPRDSISVLCDNCLMSLNSGQLWMHDLIQEMCKAKVRKESTEPGEHSRLWEPKDIFHVFNKNTGTSKIECIILNLSETNEVLELGEEAFVKMEKLRFLKFFSRELNEICTKIRLPRGLAMLPDSLTYLCWDRYPNKFLASKFGAQNLVGLSLRQSCIKQLLKGHWMFRHSSICLKRLKSLNLSGCSEFSNLSAIFDNMEHLHKLILKGTGVSNLPSSIENLTGLVKLNLSNCKNLASLPDSICNLKRLGRLDVSGCKSLQHLPEKIGNLESLCDLLADGASIKHVPASIICLKNITELSFRGCRGIKPSTFHFDWLSYWLLPRSSIYTTSCMGLPLPSFVGCQKLWYLYLSNCNLLEAPRGLHNLTSLRHLDLSGNNFETLPQTIFYNLSSLTYLKLNHCTRLRSLPELPPWLIRLEAVECTSLDSFMSSLNLYRGIGKMIQKKFSFGNCFKLKNQCNSILKSMVKEFHLAEKAAQNLYDQGYCCDHGPGLRLVVKLPGSEIPEWFNNQTVGNTLTFALPPHCLDNSLGLALCLIISPNHTNFESFSGILLELTLRDNDEKAYKNFLLTYLRVDGKCSFKDDHVVFAIASLCRRHWPNNSWLNNSNHIECSVRLGTVYSGLVRYNSDLLKVKNCAVRLVNVEEKTQPSFNASSQYLHNHSTPHCIVTDNPERRTVVGCRQCEQALKICYLGDYNSDE